ncbi:hypothetical protein JCM5350_005160 [Sporobolomyces pararoseus]
MEEDSPWGAPTSFPTPRSSPPLAVHHSPPLSTSTTSTPLPPWGIDDDGGGGWGNDTAVEEEEYGSFSLGVQGTQESTSSTIDSPPSPRKESTGDAWGNSTFQESDDTEAITSNDIQRRGDNDNDLPPIDSTLSPAAVAEEDIDVPEDDDRGWIPSTPPLPPIQTLEISSSSSPKEATFSSNSNSWEPGSFDDDQALPPPPLPSVKDLFSSSSTGGTSTNPGDGFGGERRESVGDGEEAWGAARGWEERQEKERQMELEQQEEEFRREVEEEDDDVTEEERREIERKVREAEEAAERGEDNWGSTTSGTVTRTSTSQEVERGHKGDEFDLDNPEKLKQEKKKASWWSRSRSENSRREDGVEDAVNEMKQEEQIQPQSTPQPQQVESRTSTEETQNQQVGTIGRLFGRFKKTQANSATSDGGGSTRTSAEQNRNPSSTTETKPPQNDSWQDQDFDALGSGKFGTKNQLRPHQLEIEEEEEVSGGVGRFFGDRTGSGGRGSVKSRARLPTAPPEDDFGGLLGSFSTAPVVSQAAPKPKTSKPFDPFDPLSEPSPQIAKMTVSPPPALKRPISSFAIPSPTSTSTSTSPPPTSSGDDSFDAFFDSVTCSISKPPLSSIPTPPLPSTQRTPSLIVPRASSSSSTSAKRAPLASPIPRMSTTSPPLRSPASSSNVSSRATTPILPLAPPPPPSQPLAQRNNLLGSLATPSNQPIVRPNSISPSQSPPSLSAARSSSPLEPKKGPIPAPATVRGNSGPLSRDDLDFFENL